MVEWTHRKDQFRRSYLVDAEGHGGYTVGATSTTLDYDTRGLFVLRTKIKNTGAAGITYGIAETKKDFVKLADLEDGDWETVVADGTALTANSASDDYERTLSDGIRALRITFAGTADETVEVLTLGEV